MEEGEVSLTHSGRIAYSESTSLSRIGSSLPSHPLKGKGPFGPFPENSVES